MSDLRQRGKKAAIRVPDEKRTAKKAPVAAAAKVSVDPVTANYYRVAKIVMTIVAFISRFYLLNHPDEVVFDEVHFGKFASYYLEGTYFFDLHPPFAKLLIALVGYIIGYDGRFKFDNIGDSYITNKVPFMAYRSLSATIGSLTIPLVFEILQQSGYSWQACVLGSSLVLFDNAHLAETRLILLDATLVISITGSLYTYIQFYKQRAAPFTAKWWSWLIATGVALSCVISTKYVGVFTFTTIGLAVIVDLWDLLEWKRGLTLYDFGKHFAARLFALIALPLGIFLFWFWVHFAILSKSGPGDAFMSPAFQATLGDNVLAKTAKPLNYYDIVTVKHKATQNLLSSNTGRYPLRYDDGRISSQGQLITTRKLSEPTQDEQWQILPYIDFPEDERESRPIKGTSLIRLRHVSTDMKMMTHDVASPLYNTNEEFTATSNSDPNDELYNVTAFWLRPAVGTFDNLKTKATEFRLVHLPTRVAMWTHDDVMLPAEWAPDQYEVNGLKNTLDNAAIWTFDEIIGLTDPERLHYAPKEPAKMPFLKKYLELQGIMFAQNNALTQVHPYASEPITWPFLIKGVSFWTNDPTRTQIYFIGNFFGWWLEAAALSAFVGIVIADLLTRRRKYMAINEVARSKIYKSISFFYLAWATHYFPFFLMSRQKFLHHYLPAHLMGALLTAGVFDFILGEFDEKVLVAKRLGRARLNWALTIATAGTVTLIILCFLWVSPLSYGWPGLTPEEVRSRQLMAIDLHFSKDTS